MTKTGLEQFLSAEPTFTQGARLGLICHPASIDSHYRHSADLLAEAVGTRLVHLFGPQHGSRGDKQDNMIESPDFRDPRTGRKVYSLYGKVREPTDEMLQEIDVLVFDLQDVGARVYTFIWTMALAMRRCAKLGLRFLVLDRPNPIGGEQVEGNILDNNLTSFVGLHPIPMRHGMTTGELALFLNEAGSMGVELEVVKMEGWRRSFDFDESGLPWVMPSPNMPTLDTAFIYPGSVLLEGTNLSEGRGTSRPLEIVGAPFFTPGSCDEIAKNLEISGAVLRPISFQPTFHKWSGQLCHGLQFHCTDRRQFRPFRAFIRLLGEARRLHPHALKWKAPPYEYDFQRFPIDLITGTKAVRQFVDSGEDFQDLENLFHWDESHWLETRRPYLLYE